MMENHIAINLDITEKIKKRKRRQDKVFGKIWKI